MLGSQSKKEKAKPQQRKRRMITDLPHKASSERGRFVGIFGRAEPVSYTHLTLPTKLEV